MDGPAEGYSAMTKQSCRGHVKMRGALAAVDGRRLTDRPAARIDRCWRRTPLQRHCPSPRAMSVSHDERRDSGTGDGKGDAIPLPVTECCRSVHRDRDTRRLQRRLLNWWQGTNFAHLRSMLLWPSLSFKVLFKKLFTLTLTID